MLFSAAGTSVRFEPGESKTISLVCIGGKRVIRGGNNICNGAVDVANIARIEKHLFEEGFSNSNTAVKVYETKRRKLDDFDSYIDSSNEGVIIPRAVYAVYLNMLHL